MITEDYVSYEVAKLLKEKGFDEKNVDLWYDESGEMFRELYYSIKYNWRIKNHEEVFQCPTLQMAMKWLREVHNTHISIYVFNKELPITNVPIYTCDIATEKLSSQQGHLRGVWKSYEKAVEAALKDALKNLI